MIGACTHDCWNKTITGFCTTTGCINPKYNGIGVETAVDILTYSAIDSSEYLRGYADGKDDALKKLKTLVTLSRDIEVSKDGSKAVIFAYDEVIGMIEEMEET